MSSRHGKTLPSQEVLRGLLEYCPETGALTWRPRPRSMFNSDRAQNCWNAKYAGTPAINCLQHGYRIGSIKGVGRVKAHRVIWKMIHGEEPLDIDHINHDRADNRLCNLRSVKPADNGRNRSRTVGRPLPVGVYRAPRGPNWVVSIWVNDRLSHVGRFACFAHAVAARRAAQAAAGYHPNHGRSA